MSDRPSDAEARREDRRDVVSFVWYSVLPIEPAAEAAGTEGVARSCDLSTGGIGLVIARSVSAGAWLFLELGLRVGRVSVIARVRHCQPTEGGLFRLGCVIEAVPPNDRQTVARLLGP